MYYNIYKNDYGNDDELNEAKKKKIDYRQFELWDKKDEQPKVTTLLQWLGSKNDFNKAIKLVEDMRDNTNNFESSFGDKFFFNNWRN